MSKIEEIISAKKQALLIVLSLASEVMAILLANMSNNSLAYATSCYENLVTQKVSWIFAICGVVLAIIGLRTAIKAKKRKTGPIVGAAVVVVLCCILALVAVFWSNFCV